MEIVHFIKLDHSFAHLTTAMMPKPFFNLGTAINLDPIPQNKIGRVVDEVKTFPSYEQLGGAPRKPLDKGWARHDNATRHHDHYLSCIIMG